MDLQTRFEAKVIRDGFSDCHVWAGSTSAGRGRIRAHGDSRVASRIAYELYVAPIPAGLLVLHSCDNGNCVNPAHLRVGTNADNSADMVARGRASNGQAEKTECWRGHSLTDPSNVRRRESGSRECRECARIYSRKASDIRRGR